MRYPLKSDRRFKLQIGYRGLGIGAKTLLPSAICHLLSVFSICYLLSAICLYASGTGTTAGTTLLSAVGVRQMALGNSGSSLGGDIYSAFYNPALLSDIPQKQLSTFFTTGLSNDYKASVVYGLPIQSSQKGGMAFGILHLNGGEMEINYVDGTSRDIVAQSDF